MPLRGALTVNRRSYFFLVPTLRVGTVFVPLRGALTVNRRSYSPLPHGHYRQIRPSPAPRKNTSDLEISDFGFRVSDLALPATLSSARLGAKIAPSATKLKCYIILATSFNLASFPRFRQKMGRHNPASTPRAGHEPLNARSTSRFSDVERRKRTARTAPYEYYIRCFFKTVRSAFVRKTKSAHQTPWPAWVSDVPQIF